MRNIARWAAPAAIALFLASVQFARSDQGLTGDVRTTFIEAATRSCLKTQLDAPTNKDVPVSALYDYCKCNASGMADKTSNDEVKTLEATGSEEKYRTAMQTRMESSLHSGPRGCAGSCITHHALDHRRNVLRGRHQR